ncbi:uncharacterized protein LOC131284272 [Anopheles ziemanni]|uniref:uncharacterized protein LOC131272270 n=1 Tax=Anopheles coustani TaxID=139045 RepID=UPI00265A67B5|nr:uncharacterized protein LOC131272270 [Anopheles coustani]XP_058169108.1 uncharacterized protein LOC131284272 [Anopheles ziemanni]
MGRWGHFEDHSLKPTATPRRSQCNDATMEVVYKQALKLAAPLLLLLAVTVLAGKEPGKPADSVAIASQPKSQQSAAPSQTKKTTHGKREIGSYGLHHQPQSVHRYSSFGHAQPLSELYTPATSHGAYSYSIPAHSSFPSLGSSPHKLFLGSPSTSYKYAPSVASSHAFFTPLGHHHLPQQHSFNGFPEPAPVKYGSFGTKDLSDLLKQLHAVGPLTIKTIPNSYAYGSFGEHHESSPLLFDNTNALHLKPMTIKIQELPSLPSFGHSSLPQAAALTAPAGPTSSSSTYGHVSHGLTYEPSYASGVKGLRHYSTSNGPASEQLYSKYTTGLNLHTHHNQQPAGATMVSPLHTSVHSTIGNQKPFKPSTYLGSTHETISAPSTAHAHTHPLPSGSYLAPSLQYLPPVSKVPQHPHKLSYDSPAKHGYLPPAPPSTNAYLPPHGKPTNTYLPPGGSGNSNYIPLSSSSAPSSSGSHEDTVRKPHHHQHLHSEQSGESLEYSGATVAAATPTAVTPHHWKH